MHDAEGAALPLTPGDYWLLLAISGGLTRSIWRASGTGVSCARWAC